LADYPATPVDKGLSIILIHVNGYDISAIHTGWFDQSRPVIESIQNVFFKQIGGKAAKVFPPCGNIMAVKAKPGIYFNTVIQLAPTYQLIKDKQFLCTASTC
jgi:hypothetical protein